MLWRLLGIVASSSAFGAALGRGALPRLKFLDLSNTMMGDAGLRTLTLTLTLSLTRTLTLTLTLPLPLTLTLTLTLSPTR